MLKFIGVSQWWKLVQIIQGDLVFTAIGIFLFGDLIYKALKKYRCPRCNYPVLNEDCPHCNQPIDWSGIKVG